MCNNIKNYYIKEENVLNLSDYLDYYIQQNIIDIFCKLNKYEEMMSFLLKPSTPLYPYFKAIIRFPKNYNLKDLYEKIWFNSEKNIFFNQLQLLGERKLLSTLLEELKNIYGIKTFDSDLFETYVDIIHLSGNYVKAVKLYDEYLSNYTKEEIYSSEILIHYYIRMLHHSMFFKPVKTLFYQAEELVSQKNIMLSNKDYAAPRARCGSWKTNCTAWFPPAPRCSATIPCSSSSTATPRACSPPCSAIFCAKPWAPKRAAGWMRRKCACPLPPAACCPAALPGDGPATSNRACG